MDANFSLLAWNGVESGPKGHVGTVQAGKKKGLGGRWTGEVEGRPTEDRELRYLSESLLTPNPNIMFVVVYARK